MAFRPFITGAALCALTIAPGTLALMVAPGTLALMVAPATLALMVAPATLALANDDGARISEKEWRGMAVGRTVHYSARGEFFGVEGYDPNGVTAYWRDAAGTCKQGRWSSWTVGGGPVFCFDWPVTGASCWAHLHEDGGVSVVLVDEQGRLQRDGANMFRVERIEDGAKPCEPEGVS